MRHRKKAVDKSIPSRPLVCAVLGEFCVQNERCLYRFVSVYVSIFCLCRSDGRVHCYSYDEGVSYGSLCVSFLLIYSFKYCSAWMIVDMVRINKVVCFRRCVQIIHKLICYQKKCRIRMHYTWRDFWLGMIITVCV